MKMTATLPSRALLAGLMTLVPLCIGLAADSATTTSDAAAVQPATTSAPAVTVAAAPVKLPYGVSDVLKLSRAQISEEIILNYVQSSGTIYALEPKDIIYLRDQGVSEKVIHAMIDQRKRVELAAQNAAAAQSAVTMAPGVGNAQPVDNSAGVAAAPTSTDAAAAYATAPLTPPASSTYVIPYPSAGYAPYYGPYGYYPYPYYGGYYGPSISFGFGFGHGRFGGGRGFHGGGHGSFGHGGHR